jgi:hypothetical protein
MSDDQTPEKIKMVLAGIDELTSIIETMKEKDYSEEKIKSFEFQKFMMQNELYNLRKKE